MATLDLSPRFKEGPGGLELRDRATILAYLEDLHGSGEEVRLVIQGHPALEATVLALEEEPSRFRVRLARPLPVTWMRRKEIDLLFTLDGIRLSAPVRYLERGGYLEAVLAVPAAVRHAERRSRLRVHFGSREKATVTVLEGLLGARGATGRLLDLSMEGLRMRVDRAITVHGKAPLPVAASTFAPGAHFPVLRIDQLPYSPVLVCAGVAAHVSVTAEGVQMGIRFEGLGEMESHMIRQVLGRRLPTFNQGFPERRRRPDPASTIPVTVVHHGHARPAEPAPSPRADRRILLVVQDDLDRAILATALRHDGFRKLHEARNLAQAMDHVRVFPMDAVILAGHVGSLPAAALLARLRQAGFSETVPVRVLPETWDLHPGEHPFQDLLEG